MAIALTHGGANIFSPSTPASELLVGTLNGIVFLERSTEGDWRESGKALEGRHIHALVYEPKSGLWFAGLYNDGVFVSADQGKTWEQRNNGLTETSVFSLGCVELPGGNARLYAGTEPAHLFFSDDLGQTWTELPALRDAESLPKWRFAAKPFQAHAKHLAFAPGDPVTIYVSVEVGGLHKSTDGGQTFTEIPVPHLDVHRTVVDPRNTERVFMPNGGAGLFVSPDGGATWEKLLEKENHIGTYPDLLVYASSNPDLMYIASSLNGPRSWVVDHLAAEGQIARSTDGGRTWTACMNGLPERLHGSIEAMSIEDADGQISLFAADTDGRILWTRDGGDNWKVIAQTAPVSKSIHAEMMGGGGPTPIKFSDSQLVIHGVTINV